MKKLTVFDEQTNILDSTDSDIEISNILSQIGVEFRQWPTDIEIKADDDADTILNAYKSQIDELVSKKGYLSFDVVSMNPKHPQKKEFREKFLSEHTHAEDEVRFFVRGSGLFTMRINQRIYSVLCKQGDLISVPALTAHWFDMGENPEFTAIRLFNNPDGWIANFTGSDIADNFPRFV